MAIFPGQGTILKSTLGNNNAVALFQLVEMDGPTAEQGTIEVTNLGDVVKKYRTQLPDAGEVTGTIQYDPADSTHAALTTAINQWPQVVRTWTEILPTTANNSNGSSMSFSAFITKFSPKGMNEDDNLEADMALKLTGLITWPTN